MSDAPELSVFLERALERLILGAMESEGRKKYIAEEIQEVKNVILVEYILKSTANRRAADRYVEGYNKALKDYEPIRTEELEGEKLNE